MSEELLQKFLTSIEQEDGITEVGRKRKKSKTAAVRDNVKTILHAASKGQVQLSPEESYIVQNPSTSRSDYIDDRLASQGFSLIDQARSHKPKDLKKRNLKYMKFQEGRRLDPKKGQVLVSAHMKTKADLKNLRKEKKVVVGVKEPRRLLPGQKKKQKSKSVFSDADFAQVAHVAKRINAMSDHSFL